MSTDIGVSLAEIVEVRGCGLTDEELLALVIIGCEVLAKSPTGVFSPEQVILHTDGELQIKTVPKDAVSAQYVPPEVLEGNTDVEAGAVHVFCLGEVIRFAGAAESENADLFSLLNVMTVAHVATRPSVTRLGQMAKNKLAIQNPKALLAEMYVLVMGDEADDIDDLDLSSGEYVLSAIGADGAVEDLSWLQNGRDSAVLTGTNGVDHVVEEKASPNWPKTSTESDPFEEEEGSNLWTLSGRDPFNKDFIDHADEGSSSKLNEEPRKEKQRRMLVSTDTMLLAAEQFGEVEDEELPPKKKPTTTWDGNATQTLSYPDSYDYDDDIVEYREGPLDENVEPKLAFREEGSPPKVVNVPRGDDQGEQEESLRDSVEVEQETHPSLSPISEANENGDKAEDLQSARETSLSVESEMAGYGGTVPSRARNEDFTEECEILQRDDELRSSASRASSSAQHVAKELGDEELEESRFLSDVADQISGLKTSESSESVTQQFTRRNSLLPDRISGRKSSSRRAKRKLRAEPEFTANVNAPAICLKAPAMRKKKVTLHRVEHTDVTVELLSGKHVEVSCRSDAVASEIADVVMRHMNFNENSFFGLTVMRDGEHFFLDDHQRLEKFAPPGWKNARQRGYSRRLYTLYLRFRYYPASVTFIKTSVVLHELYLQLRRDILADRLQPKKEIMIELAALALQAEYGDKPNIAITDYFVVEQYIPKRYIDNGVERELISAVAETHGKLRTMEARSAENRYILLCQRLSDYGAHLHRVFTSKPSTNLGNTPLGDPETGVAQWIGILARGIVQYEEQSEGRHALVEHLWQNTQTLQFDKKRFVIVSEVHDPSRNVFFTDHYTKSAYFVRFAASQHRFMIKMRQWNQSLRHDSPFQFHKIPDVGADTTTYREASQVSGFIIPTARNVYDENEDGQLLGVQTPTQSGLLNSASDTVVQASATPSPAVERQNDEAVHEKLSENNDGYTIDVSLRKDPQTGLGLTLVDGTLNGIKGVYVKSVTEGGAGKRGGVNVGDRLMSVNGVSLVGKDRHATVDLVRQGGDTVQLKIFRLDAISSAFSLTSDKGKKADDEHRKPLRTYSPPSIFTARSRTPPAPRKASNLPKKRPRAVSDFGAVGDALPELNSEDLLANLRNDAKFGALESESSVKRGEENSSGDYTLPAAAMYRFEGIADENVPDSVPKDSLSRVPYEALNDWSKSNGKASFVKYTSRENMANTDLRKQLNLDWAESLDDVADSLPSATTNIALERNESGSLGFQITSSGGYVYVKQITAEPAISCPNIHVGDRIVSVNDERLYNLTHEQVVDLLRNGGQTVVLGLQHADTEKGHVLSEIGEQTICVVLEKSQSGSLGLSLAKKTGLDGIYIRMISSGSAADIDGTLRVGDKIWQVNGQKVNDCTPGAIVDMLKAASNPVTIVVKRACTK